MWLPSSTWNVEYLSRLTAAMGALEARIKEHVTRDLIFKDRTSKICEVHPGQTGYSRALSKFSEEVSDQRSIVILIFLYQFDKYLSKELDVFTRTYKPYFDLKLAKWDMVVYNYPRIDQTTLSVILDSISETIIGYRLEDLARIGLIERSTLKPPHPKHVWISPKGISAVENAIQDGMSHLGPIFSTVSEFSPEPSRDRGIEDQHPGPR